MEREKEELLEEAVQLELNMADPHLFYYDNFLEDAKFWWQMAKEEKEHAALVELAKDFFDKFPKDIIYGNIGELKEVNRRIKGALERYKEKSPSKKDAYAFAINIETSAYELHYQQLSVKKSDSEEVKRCQKLNQDDKNHAARIKKLFIEKAI